MVNRIFTNGEEGKILTSVGNRIIKQPYEFGNAFQNRMGLNNYFELDNILLPTNWSIITLGNFPTGEDGGVFQAISTSLNLADNLAMRGGSFGINFTNYIGGGYSVDNRNTSNVALRYSTSSATFVKRWVDVILATTTSAVSRTEAARDKIRVGASGEYHTNNTAIGHYFPTTWKLNLIAIFNRELNNQELLYFRNNLLYNDFQSLEGCVHLWYFNGVEDINSLPCPRDMVGTYHLPMLKLPAGTLQQKLDYANTNLFVPFI